MSENYGSYNPDRELEELYAAITGRPAFSYTPGSDPLYRSYADRYIQNGRLAMRDTMGQSAALTGGYGSSYAQSAGQQRYDEYLRSLGEVLPELYGKAWERYQAECQALRDAYSLNWQRRDDAYRRGRDELADSRYLSEQELKAAERSYKQQQDSYNQLYKLIAETGYEPTDEELAAAGLSREQAEALRKEYRRKIKKGSGGSYGGGSRGGSKRKDEEDETAAEAAPAGAGESSLGPTAGGLLGLSGILRAGGRR